MRSAVQAFSVTFALVAVLFGPKPASAFRLSEVKNAHCENNRGSFTLNRRAGAVVLQLAGMPLYVNGSTTGQQKIFATPVTSTIKLGSSVVSADATKSSAVVFIYAGIYQELSQTEQLPVAFVNDKGQTASFSMRCTLIN